MSDIFDFQLGGHEVGTYIVIIPRGLPEPPLIILLMFGGFSGVRWGGPEIGGKIGRNI